MTKRSATDPTEHQLHKSVVEFLRLALHPDVVFFHAPGEGKRGWRGQADIHDLGYYTGFPDLGFYANKRGYCIELKREGADLSPDQRVCHEHLCRAGIPVEVCRSIEDVKFCLSKWAIPMRGVTLT